MEKLMNVASYICNRYKDEYGSYIDEMKLHKLLYFAQRESLIMTDEPLFDGTFYGWKYGPVLKDIRSAYRDDKFYHTIPHDVESRISEIMDRVFDMYAGKDSWSLSRLTHGEYSWKKSRIGVEEKSISDNPIDLDDIRIDAQRVRDRRQRLAQFGLG